MRTMLQLVGILSCALAVLAVAAVCPQTASAEEGQSLTETLQALVADLTMEQQAALYLLLTELTEPSAKAAEAKAEPSPQETFKEALAVILKAAKEEDLDTVMNMISDDFELYEVGDKEALRGFLKDAIDMGYVEMYAGDIEVKVDDAEFKRDGNKVAIYPVVVEGSFGSVTIELQAQLEEDGVWRITGLDISGM